MSDDLRSYLLQQVVLHSIALFILVGKKGLLQCSFREATPGAEKVGWIELRHSLFGSPWAEDPGVFQVVAAMQSETHTVPLSRFPRCVVTRKSVQCRDKILLCCAFSTTGRPVESDLMPGIWKMNKIVGSRERNL